MSKFKADPLEQYKPTAAVQEGNVTGHNQVVKTWEESDTFREENRMSIAEAMGIGGRFMMQEDSAYKKAWEMAQEVDEELAALGKEEDEVISEGDLSKLFPDLDVKGPLTAKQAILANRYSREFLPTQEAFGQLDGINFAAAFIGAAATSMVTPVGAVTNIAASAALGPLGTALAGTKNLIRGGAAFIKAARAAQAARSLAPTIRMQTARRVLTAGSARISGVMKSPVAKQALVHSIGSGFDEVAAYKIEKKYGLDRDPLYMAFGFLAPLALPVAFKAAGKGVTKIVTPKKVSVRTADRISKLEAKVAKTSKSADEAVLAKNVNIKEQIEDLKEFQKIADHPELKGIDINDPVAIAAANKQVGGTINPKTGELPTTIKGLSDSLAAQKVTKNVTMDDETRGFIEAIDYASGIFGDTNVHKYFEEIAQGLRAMGKPVKFEKLLPEFANKEHIEAYLNTVALQARRKGGVKGLNEGDFELAFSLPTDRAAKYLHEEDLAGPTKIADASEEINKFKEVDVAKKLKELAESGGAKNPMHHIARAGEAVKKLSKEVAGCNADPKAYKEAQAAKAANSGGK